MKNIVKFVTLLALLLVFQVSRADEGMWLVNLLDKNLTKKMQKEGLKVDPKLIYDENNPSISNAVVALDFGCTGSIISNDGLLITNHHCAYSDIHALSTPEKNYLEDGFWAMKRAEEIPISGKSVYFLRKVIDATDEIKAVTDSLRANKQSAGMRRLSSLIETKYNKISGLETSLVPMWRGSKYYVFFYEVYTDIRLVGAPPVSIAAYGGETDNWAWPQHKGDFALYRVYGSKDGKPAVYSQENLPISPKKVLSVSTKGVKDGDFTMILGFPGRTNRYNNSFVINQMEKVTNPVEVKLKRGKLDIMNKWMNTNPAIRLKYADNYFNIGNVWELRQGEVINFRRFGVVKIKQEQEKELQEWINQDPGRVAKWGDLLNKLETRYKGTEVVAKARAYFKETMISGTGFVYFGNRTSMLRGGRGEADVDTLRVGTPIYKSYVNVIETGFEQIDMRVEKELMEYQIKEFLENVPVQFWGEYLKDLYAKLNKDSKAVAAYIFDNSIFMHPEKFREAVKINQPGALFLKDPINLFCKSNVTAPYNAAEEDVWGKEDINTLEAQYTKALYQMNLDKNRVQYPDANSTMRLTYGTVGPINPSDGVYYSSHSSTQGLWDKYNPDDYEFNMKPKMIDLLKTKDWGNYGEKDKMYINFLSNNDITGGNSGSPVLNAKGELVGLAFDGNKESLASDAYFHPEMNKCVNVDIRYVLWIIEKYAGAGYLIKEMNIVK
ncbi:MAG: S46 family peptidase [Bacteroidales bacterium]